jgi:hypothetical protein
LLVALLLLAVTVLDRLTLLVKVRCARSDARFAGFGGGRLAAPSSAAVPSGTSMDFLFGSMAVIGQSSAGLERLAESSRTMLKLVARLRPRNTPGQASLANFRQN